MKLNNELTHAQENFRRGSTSYHAKKTLTAKAIRTYIVAHPGSTKQEITEAVCPDGAYGGFELLQKHKLVRCEGRHPAKWYPVKPAV